MSKTNEIKIEGLDHAGLVVHDLPHAARQFSKLGFRLTPLSMHSGTLEPGGPNVPFGTGNQCAMLENTYLELISPIDQSLPCGIYPSLLDRYEGLHIIAFAADDTHALDRRLRDQGVEIDGVYDLSRKVEINRHEHRLEFSLLRMARQFTPEARTVAVHHKTPEFLWTPGSTDHPNGSQDLVFIMMVVQDVREAAQRYSKILSTAPHLTREAAIFQLGHGELRIYSQQAVHAYFGIIPPCLPYNAGLGISVRSLPDLRKYLIDSQVAFTEHDLGVIVPAELANGASCIFVDSESYDTPRIAPQI